MDNFSHSLFGAAVAESYIQIKKINKTTHPKITFWIYVTSILANNLPDFDLLLHWIDPTPLGYLLNHRGWTHTLIGSFLLSLVLLIFLSRLPQKKTLFFVALIGCQTHILLDFFNSYGVHPLWPISNHWYSLDSIFILEPLLWIPLCLLWFSTLKKWSLFTLLLLALYLWGWQHHLVVASSLVLPLSFLTMGFILILRKQIPKALTLLFMYTGLVVLFWSFQKVARIQTFKKLETTETKTIDLVFTNIPSNPFCWFYLAPQITAHDYIVVRGEWSLNAQLCPERPPSANRQEPLTFPIKLSRADLPTKHANCREQAWFRFARVPYWDPKKLTDLRFALNSSRNFSTLDRTEIKDKTSCPPLPAPWTPWRSDLGL